MAEKRRLNLAFSLAKPHQRRAWNWLSAIPAGQRTDAVCRLIRNHLDRRELLDNLRAIVREELGAAQIQAIQKEKTTQAGDVDEDVLGFLLALQKGDDNP